MSLKYLIAGSIVLMLIGGDASSESIPPGWLEGHLKIVSLKPVELADGTISKGTSEAYADYPLVILSGDGKKEVARVTAGQDGNYRVMLPPGDYILDILGRGRKNIRAKPQTFTVVSNQAVRVDMDMDTGIR